MVSKTWWIRPNPRTGAFPCMLRLSVEPMASICFALACAESYNLAGMRIGVCLWTRGAKRMSVFTEKEIEYLGGQRLGRLATVDSAGNPHVVPVGFRYNAERDTIDIGGQNVADTAKWRNAERH